jgi:hypothetical protein
VNDLTMWQRNNLAILASYPDMKIINYHGYKAYNFYDWGKKEMGKNVNPKHVEYFLEKGLIEKETWTMHYQTYRASKLGKQTHAEQFKPNLDTIQAENAALRARVGRLEALAKEVEHYLEHEGASEDLYLAWKALEAEGAGE